MPSRGAGLPWIVLVAASIAFRLPAFVNARDVDSDAAIVGLQAMHILRGEFSWFLLGSMYQTSTDSFIAALFFLVSGAGALSLMLSAFAGHLLATLFAYATVRRHASPWTALLLVVPLVLTPYAVHIYALHPPRQASLTLVFASIWALDGAARARVPEVRYGVGAALAILACFADPYAFLFLPPLALLALLACFDASPVRSAVVRRLVACVGGAAVGAIPLVLLFSNASSSRDVTKISAGMLAHNWGLFSGGCFPWALSLSAFRAGPSGWEPWQAPAIFRAVQIAGALLFLGGFAYAAVAVRRRSIPWEVRRLGIVGAVTFALTVAGFMGSVMVMDLNSTRYLAAIVLISPFALAPAARTMGARRFGAALAPYAVSVAVAGWLAFTPWVVGPRIVLSPAGAARDESLLASELLRRGVGHAMADYWVSYRLTFLYGEKILVVPSRKGEDRYAAYRAAFDAAPIVAYVFDPNRSRERIESMEQQLRDAGVRFDAAERLEAGTLTAIVARRSR